MQCLSVMLRNIPGIKGHILIDTFPKRRFLNVPCVNRVSYWQSNAACFLCLKICYLSHVEQCPPSCAHHHAEICIDMVQSYAHVALSRRP